MLNNNLLYESGFTWHPSTAPSTPLFISGSLQPSSKKYEPSLLNTAFISSDVSIMTPEVDVEFAIFDKVSVFSLDWYISAISEVHPVVVDSTTSPMLHKTLYLRPLPLRRFPPNYITQLFGERKVSAITVIKKYFNEASDDTEIIEQFKTVLVPSKNFILISLEGLSYDTFLVSTESELFGVAEIGLRAVGSQAHADLKSFFKDIRSLDSNLSIKIEKALITSGVKSPSQFLTVTSPEIETFTMAEGYFPEVILKTSINLPFVDKSEVPLEIMTLEAMLETTTKYSTIFRRKNVEIQKSNS